MYDELEQQAGECVTELGVGGKQIRIQHKRLLLTYKTHVPKDALRGLLERIAKGEIECYIAHEVASSKTNYEHTHVYVDFGKTFNSRSPRVFDFNGIHPNILFIKTRKPDAVLRYIAKEDPSLIELKLKYELKKDGLMGAIWKHDDVRSALSAIVQTPSDVSGVIAGFNYKVASKMEPLAPEVYLHYEWQRLLWVKLLQKDLWDYRSLIWIYDGMGGMGKSMFCKCWESNNDACVLTLASGQRDIATVIANKIRSGWNQEVVFLDFPRGEANHKIYTSIETILNGRITVAKYNGACVDIIPSDGSRQPKVVVFANWLPNYIGNNTLSKDRFQVWNVCHTGRVVILSNPERDDRIKREKMLEVNTWTIDKFQSMADGGELKVEDLRYHDYLMNTLREYEYEQPPIWNGDIGNILPDSVLTTIGVNGGVREEVGIPVRRLPPRQQQRIPISRQHIPTGPVRTTGPVRRRYHQGNALPQRSVRQVAPTTDMLT